MPDSLRPLPYPGSLHPQWNQVDSWVLDGTPRTLSTIDARAGRYILIAVWGSGHIRLRNLSVYEERYPLAQKGSFHSSSPLLDTIWQIGVDTAIPNMTGAYADPWRERGSGGGCP
jgi:alpha-L-rhamnosidase